MLLAFGLGVVCCTSCIGKSIVRKSTSESVTPFQPTNQPTSHTRSPASLWFYWRNRTLGVRSSSSALFSITHADTWGIERVHRIKFEYNITQDKTTQKYFKAPRTQATEPLTATKRRMQNIIIKYIAPFIRQ